MTVLEALRRRKQTLGRVVLPLLGVAWLGLGASPCIGMAADTVRDSGDSPSPMAHGAEHAAISHLGHGAQPAPGSDAPQHDHGGCPHCPVAPQAAPGEVEPAHIPCLSLDDAADNGAHASSVKWDLKHVLPAADFVPAVLSASRAAVPATAGAEPACYPSVALHLLHCVFLI
jgi:hypothetical protein